jgi:uncharacterized protein YcbK (DUF882 family)
VVRNHALDALNELSEMIARNDRQYETLELISTYQAPSSKRNIRRRVLLSMKEGREQEKV